MTTKLTLSEKKKQFEIVAKDANSLLLVQSASAAFDAVEIVSKLRNILDDEVMNTVFMPLMNTRIGYLTDKPSNKDNSKYTVHQVRDCIIDAISFGLTPTFNQFNIIAGNMYPTKEGYTYLLKKIGVKYFMSIGQDNSKTDKVSEIPVKIFYEYGGEKNDFTITATVRKTNYSTYDQQKGKAEKRAKKALYELITGKDLGDSDDEIIDVESIDITSKNKNNSENQNESINKDLFGDNGDNK